MSSFQGLIRRNIINANTQFEKLGYVTTNVSNYSTTGYKAVRFEQILDENGYLQGVLRKDYQTGAARKTDQPLDIALDGTGFIPVTSRTGDVTYTREGSFKIDKDGYIVTNDGCLVGDGIKLPTNYDFIRVKENGDVAVIKDSSKGKEEVVGTIPIVNFQNPEGLKASDNNKYLVTADSGEPVLVKNHKKVKQGYLEQSNVNLYDQVNETMRLNASMLASFKLMKAIDDMYNKSINLNQ